MAKLNIVFENIFLIRDIYWLVRYVTFDTGVCLANTYIFIY
jgi:hypothetical protein